MAETPFKDNGLSDEKKISIIESHFREIMETLGLDLKDDSLHDTPKRLAKMYVNELFSGLHDDRFPRMTTIENKMGADQMIVVKRIRVMTVCEHHFQPIHGTATVAYIPQQKILGLSKFNRIVEYFGRRPQVQERMTKQIADAMQRVLGTDSVAVYIDAKHYCVIARGVEDENSSTITIDCRGSFKTKPETRAEFLSAAGV